MGNLNVKIDQLKKIKNGKGLQYILDEIYAFMGNPALIFDMEYKLIASPAGAVNDDPIWCEFMTHGGLSSETIEFFKKESFIDSVANCTQFDGVTYLFSDKLKYDRIFGQLYNKDLLPVADLVMVACENPFEEDTPELIKTACNIISDEISLDEYYQNYGHIYQDSILEKLIEGDIGDKEVYTGHVSNIDKGLKSNVFIAVADVTKSNSANASLSYFRDLFKRTEPSFKYSIYSDYVIILISSNYPKLRINRELNNLIHLFEQENIYAGISSRFENLFDLHRYYLEAVNALNNSKKVFDSQKINIYDKKSKGSAPC